MATKVLNLSRLQRKLRALPGAVRTEMMAALVASGEQIMATQRRLVDDRTGATRDSIRLTEDPANVKVVIEAGGPLTTKPVRKGADAEYDYVMGLEFGTKPHKNSGKFKGTQHPGTAAQPFFYPGYRANKKSAKARISRAINRAAKKVAHGA